MHIIIKIMFFVMCVCALSKWASADTLNNMLKHSAPGVGVTDCPMERAIYKPHSAYRPKKLDFTLTVENPPQKMKTTERFLDYYVHAFLGGKQVSSYRMPLVCGNGSAGCYIGGREFLELDQNMKEARSQFAPYALVISDLPKINGNVNNFEGLNFYTKEKIYPDFSDINLWVLQGCKER